MGVRADAVAPGRAGPGLLHDHGDQRPGRRSRSPSTWWWSRTWAPTGSCSAPSAPGCSSSPGCSGGSAGGSSLRPDVPLLRRMVRFGLPTMPAELTLYSLQLHRPDHHRPARRPGRGRALRARGQVRQRAPGRWPAGSSSRSRRWRTRSATTTRRAASTRCLVTWFAALLAFAVVGLWLEARWLVRLLAADEFFPAYEAVGPLAAGVALYALYLAMVVVLGRTGPDRVRAPGDRGGRRRQHRAQPDPGPGAGDRRRRDRPGRLLRRGGGADVRVHPAAVPGAVRVAPAGAGARGVGGARSPSARPCCPRRARRLRREARAVAGVPGGAVGVRLPEHRGAWGDQAVDGAWGDQLTPCRAAKRLRQR